MIAQYLAINADIGHEKAFDRTVTKFNAKLFSHFNCCKILFTNSNVSRALSPSDSQPLLASTKKTNKYIFSSWKQSLKAEVNCRSAY